MAFFELANFLFIDFLLLHCMITAVSYDAIKTFCEDSYSLDWEYNGTIERVREPLSLLRDTYTCT